MKKVSLNSKSPAPVGQRLIEQHNKGTKRISDYQIVFNEFAKEPQTMMQVTFNTGIPTQYICWHVREMRQKEVLQTYRLGRCPKTGEDGVQFLTTDPALLKSIPKQLSLF
jgi:hypothetical protein